MASRVKLGDASLLGILSAIELEVALRVHRLRSRLQPEIDQVEVVRAFVDQESTAVSLVAMPSSKVIRSMRRVQHPFEVHTGHFTDSSGLKNLENLGVVGCVTIVEGHPYVLARPVYRLQDFLASGCVNGHCCWLSEIWL